MPGASSESRGNKFISRMNANIPDRDAKITEGGYEVALKHVLLVADVDQDTDPDMHDRAKQVAKYLGGATLSQIGRDASLNTRPYSYSAGDRDQAVLAVAARAAGLFLMIHSDHSKDTSDLDLKLDVSIADTVRSLHEQGLISESIAKGMFVVFGEVNVENLNPDAVRMIRSATMKVLRSKMGGKQRQFPFVNKVVGNTQDGLVPRDVQQLALEQRSIAGYDKALKYVQTRISHELYDLYSPRHL